VTVASLVTVLASCRDESTGTNLPPAPPELLASRHAAHDEGPPQFSDWSAPVNLGSVVNSAGPDFDPFITKDGLRLYFTGGRNREEAVCWVG
jgi:hypothetical protein